MRTVVLLALVPLLVAPGPGASRLGQAVPHALRPTPLQEAWVERHASSEARAELGTIARAIAREGTLGAATEHRWRTLVGRIASSGTPVDVSALVQ